jgi:uncharacterized protein YhaN
MNLVGKIFIVVIFVMSLVFMTMALLVYAMHKNWREVVVNETAAPNKPLGLSPQLRVAKAENEKLTGDLTKLKQQLDTEKRAQQQAATKLENERDQALKFLHDLEKEKAQLEGAKRDAIAAMDATQKNATAYRQELDKLRTDILQAQQDRDAHFKRVVELTDQLNEAVNEKEQLRSRTGELAKDLARTKEALRWSGGPDPNSDFKAKAPPRVDGVVTAAMEGNLVEISIGSDMGVRKGHQLEVYRVAGGQSTYVGRVEVVQTSPDKSVCKMDPKFQNSNVMVGDRVASKID